MISIIHPSRGRPEKSFRTINKWYLSADKRDDIEFIISLDEDDDTFAFYERIEFNANKTFLINKNRSAVDAINHGGNVAKGDILIVVSDDTDCPLSWDIFLLKLVAGKKDWVLKTNDGIQPWIITMPVMDMEYFNRTGYIYYPDYKHMFCDTELTCVADLTGRKITSNIVFKHLKYEQQPDAVSKKADSTWDQGEKLFLERYKRNFDLPADQIKGKIQDGGMINWLQRKVR